MLITEFRIQLPMTLDEYRIGHLYSIADMSRNETGGGEGVEILTNEPYQGKPMFHGEFPDGQYTHKVYHIPSKVPRIIRSLAPNSSLNFHEVAWNAYPYCKTEIANPEYMKDGFSVTIETMHLADRGDTENAHRLTPEELEKREIVYIDIANGPVGSVDYKTEEDPAKFKSQKTGRGPLDKTWTKTVTPVMCCYKLVRIEFKWSGLQTKVERMLVKMYHRMFTKFYRQLFCQIDQWHGLTMDNIRAIEKETRRELIEARQKGEVKGTVMD